MQLLKKMWLYCTTAQFSYSTLIAFFGLKDQFLLKQCFTEQNINNTKYFTFQIAIKTSTMQYEDWLLKLK